MTELRWDRVKELLHEAMQLAPEQRDEFLNRACGSEPALRAELESLLAADVGASFLQSPLPGIGAGSSLLAGEIFEQRFRLVRRLGEGGMGQVWLADQLSPVRRRVALKLIKAGMYDQAVVQRFQSERQSLAMMDHPTIAKVFDAGTTAQGQPYFVMDYVPGLPITDYCDQHQFSIAQRLELFIQVCEGIQHAHQKATIHRDIKPANVLVMEVDGRPAPRIIDFGLSKMINPQVAEQKLLTRFGQFMGTPGYMSPEQINSDVQDIDTRTDVYSLGVVLYVLLTGIQPFESEPRRNQPLDELLRKLRTEEPPLPSSKVRADGSTSASAVARGTQPRQLLRLLRGDLDWITMKALESDRARRYGTPSELAADLRRHLSHEPVMARPANTSYRLRMYVRRHRVAVSVAAGLIVLLTAFSVLQGLELRRTTQERDRANRERDRATRITDFMTGMFKVSDPGQARGNSVTAREILDKASAEMASGLSQDPASQSQMMNVMAQTYANLGLYGRAHDLAQQALNTRLSTLGADDPKTLESMSQLGWIMDLEGQYTEAEKLERQALAGESRVLGQESPLTLETMSHLAILMEEQGHFDEGEKLARYVIAVGTRTLGPASAQVMQSMKYLGNGLWYQGRHADAEREYRLLVDVERRAAGPDDPETLAAINNLALSIQSQKRFTEAEQMYRDNVATAQRVLGLEHPRTVGFLQNFAGFLYTEGRTADAEKLYREVWAIRVKTLGAEHPDALITKSELADVLFDEGRIREAEKLQRETLAVWLRVLGRENLHTLRTQGDLAKTLIKEGRYAEAEKLAHEAFELESRSLGPQDRITLFALLQLGRAMAYEHRYAEASKLFRNVINDSSNSGGFGNRYSVWYSFACLAETANHPAEALQYLREAISRGYTNGDGLLVDEDLKDLRQNPQFQQLVASLKRAPTTGK